MMDEMNKCMDKLDTLPPSIRKHAEQITEHDKRCQELLKEIHDKTYAYAKGYKKLSRDMRSTKYQEIMELYSQAEKLSDKKVKIATKMYDLVDSHIKEMDKLSARFGEQQRLKYEQEARKLNGGGDDTDGESRKRRGSRKDLKKKKRKDQKESSLSETFPSMAMPMIPVVEMPVDPNEPTYCICNQVSFGEMVMCDGKNCRTEWFHFQCVGLTQIPPGKWYCDACDPKKKKKQ